MIDSINLPSPRPLLLSLLEAGFSHEIAIAASNVYQQRAEELKRRMETMLIATWQKITTPPGATTSSVGPLTRGDVSSFTEVYLRYLEEWKEEMVQLLRQALKVPSKAASSRSSRSFNHEYLPLLEHFFEENPFPTHADKVFLAKKSKMQYRQIHVWFQNRRNRTKRADKSFRKKPMFEGATKPLNKLYERMKVAKPDSQSLRPSQASSSAVDDQLPITQNDAPKGIFTSPAPPHAFPSSYPPTCAYDPFPCTSGQISFGKLEWRRVPCSKPPLPGSICVDDLAEKFSQLNVRGNSHTKGSLGLQSHAATVAITVVPPRAPHPALVVYSCPKFAHVAVYHPPCSHTHLTFTRRFQDLVPTSKAVTLIPLSIPSHGNEPCTKRKTVPLPQRLPRRMQNSKRDTSPSEYSYTSSSSGVSSLGSTNRSYSLSSASSSPSPTNMAAIRDLPRLPS